MSLKENVDKLVEELWICGHRISNLDILDVLATTGLTIVDSPENDARHVYMDSIVEARQG